MSNKDIVIKYIDRLWNQKDLSAIDEFFAIDAKLRSPLGVFESPEGMKKIVETWFGRVPDMKVKQLHVMEDGDLVSCHWQATGKNVDYQGVTIHRVKDGKVVEYWAYVDRVEF